MFEFFKKSNKKNKIKKGTSAAPGTQIHFVPDLIDNLEEDHKILLTTFGQIKTAFEANNYKIVKQKLTQFRRALTDHLLTENVRLYIYLDHSFSADDMNGQLVRSFRSEMNDIAKAVMAFLNKYEKIDLNSPLASSFGTDLEHIGAALVERIKREENTLYPLYLPQY